MDQTALIVVVAVVVLAIVVVVGWFYARQRRSALLRKQFGPEYERVVRQEGDQAKAEGVLQWRTKRRERLQIRPLGNAARTEFAERWRAIQSRFVDDPKGAVSDADSLLSQVMEARGYPIANFDQRADDISVDHPTMVQNYRAAHDIALRHSRGEASTEDLRTALVHYRSLFEELLEDNRKKEALG